VGRSVADEELAVRRGMMAFLLGDGGPSSAYGWPRRTPDRGSWTGVRRVGYGIQKATFIIRELLG